MTSRRLVVEADGGSRGNPGPAAFGALVRDADTGRVLVEVGEPIGRATNNVAEYRGLIAGLQAARSVDPSAVLEVRMDSKLVVSQMRGEWRVKHPDMKPLALEAAGLARGFAAVTWTWVPRERNREADRLVNEALDGRPQGEATAAVAAAGPGGGPDSGDVPERGPEAPVTQLRLPGWTPPTSPPTTMLLLRHGETALTAERRFSGWGEAELSARGSAQVEAAAVRLAKRGGIDVVVSSPIRRTRASADVVAAALGAEVVEDDGVREVNFGDWDGLTFGEVRERWPGDLAAWLSDAAYAPPGGESLVQVAARVEGARERIVSAYPGRTVLVVSHVTPIKLLVRTALAVTDDVLFRMHISPASLSLVEWYAEPVGSATAVLRLLNDTSHLVDLPGDLAGT